MDINVILNDISVKLDIDIKKSNIEYFTDGASGSIVFSIDDKYLIKTMTDLELKVQIEFLSIYNNDHFQKIVYYNKKLKYICFEYIDGNKIYKYISNNEKNIIKEIYHITNLYKLYRYDGYGYLYEDNKSWYQFLYDEVMYSKNKILDINIDKVIKSLNTLKKYNIDKYLIHGDFGTHNFLYSNDKIKVIDPMGLVGDYLYDFYFAILSEYNIFRNINIDYILSFYDRDIEYKKSLFVVVFFIRMSRCYVYDREDFNNYLEIYDKL